MKSEAGLFAEAESIHAERSLFGRTDGKAVGTYLEHKFRDWLVARGFGFEAGNSATGIDFPGLNVDMKVTSIDQPQSSCPFRSASQKVYGLGYSLLVFVYAKADDAKRKAARLLVKNVVFVSAERTADYQITRGLIEILERDGNVQDVEAYLHEKHLPLDDIGLAALAAEVLRRRPLQGYLTVSNALQWRLQYGRAIGVAGTVEGVAAIRAVAH